MKYLLTLLVTITFISSCADADNSYSSDNSSCESNPGPVLTNHITDLQYVKAIAPPGSIAAGNEIVGRSYLFIKDDVREAQTLVPVYAPANAKLISLAYYNPSSDPDYPPDYALTFRLSCEVTFGFAHLKQVVDAISAVAPSEPNTETSAQNSLETSIEFSAGDLIGYYKTSPTAFDFYFENTATPNSYVNQERYENDSNSNALNQVCGYDYMTDDLRSAYFALFGTYNGSVSGTTSCRSASRDVVGTLSGTWFLDSDIGDGTAQVDNGNYRWRLDIAMALDQEIKFGTLGNELKRIYSDYETHKDPATVTTSHCYEFLINPTTPQGYAYFNIVSDSQMQIVYNDTETCPNEFPTSGYVTYYR